MSGIQNWQTLKDLATQLLIKYKSGTLVTQYCFCVSGFLRICVCLCSVWRSQAFHHVVHLDGCVRRLRPSRQWCKVKHVTLSHAKSLMLKSKNVNLHPGVFSPVPTLFRSKVTCNFRTFKSRSITPDKNGVALTASMEIFFYRMREAIKIGTVFNF